MKCWEPLGDQKEASALHIVACSFGPKPGGELESEITERREHTPARLRESASCRHKNRTRLTELVSNEVREVIGHDSEQSYAGKCVSNKDPHAAAIVRL